MDEPNMTNDNNLNIIECTMRDGSYVLDNYFTVEDTYIICRSLVNAGFRFIEVGLGTGLRGSSSMDRRAGASDEEYLAAGCEAVSDSDAIVGAFLIPGIGTLDDLDLAADIGLGFIRIGTNVTEVESAKPFIERAKSRGMLVFSNLMKSYAVSESDFMEKAKIVDKYGADVITMVDSAGGMFPKEVRGYIENLKQVTAKDIGFHAHNNLQLAIANTMEAIDCGAKYVDSTMQGMGRSGGNAQTEVLLAVLERLGYRSNIDFYRALDIGDVLVRPMMSNRNGVDAVSVACGCAQFHSGYCDIVYDAAARHGVDPRALIAEVSKRSLVHVTNAMTDEAARTLKSRDAVKSELPKLRLNPGYVCENDGLDGNDLVETIKKRLVSMSKKSGKESVLSITLSKGGRTMFPYLRQSLSKVIANCEAAGIDELKNLVSHCDGYVDWLLFDRSSNIIRESVHDISVARSRLAYYSERRIILLSTAAVLGQLDRSARIVVFASSDDYLSLKTMMQQQGYSNLYDGTQNGILSKQSDLKPLLVDSDALVSFGREYTAHLIADHAALASRAVIYGTGGNAYSDEFWNASVCRGNRMLRIDSRVGLASEVELVVETNKMLDIAGSAIIDGVTVVSGGFIGKRGDAVVDSFKNPTACIGFADGYGGLIEEGNLDREALRSLQVHLTNNFLRLL